MEKHLTQGLIYRACTNPQDPTSWGKVEPQRDMPLRFRKEIRTALSRPLWLEPLGFHWQTSRLHPQCHQSAFRIGLASSRANCKARHDIRTIWQRAQRASWLMGGGNSHRSLSISLSGFV